MRRQQESRPREVARFVAGYLRADRGRAVFFVSGMLIYVVLTVASTRLIGDAVAEVDRGATLETLGWTIGLVLAAFAGSIAARWLADRAINAHTSEAMAAIVESGFAKVQAFDTGWHADNFAGATSRKVTRAAQGYDMFVSCCYFFFLPSLLLVLVTAATIADEAPLAAGAMIAGSIVYFGVTVWFNTKYVMPRLLGAFALDSRITGEMVDLLGNNAAVKSWATERREESRFAETVQRWQRTMTGAWNMAVASDQLQAAISALILVGPIAIVILEARFGRAGAGTVATVIGAGFVLRGWLGNIGRGVREAQNAISEMTEMVALLARPSEADQEKDKREFVPGKGAIRFESVHFAYQDAGSAVFSDLSLEIRAGQTVALVGPSGGGKSTFCKLVMGLYTTQSGRVMIDGQDIADCTRASFRAEIALVPQDPALFHRTIAENIAYGRPELGRADIESAAAQARLDGMIDNLPDRYDTLVGERGVKLSGGERQRVAIARALLSDRPIMIFDEATSSLDTANEQAIQEALRYAMAGRTTIIVAHRLSTVRHADRILVFDKGSVVEDGSHEALSRRRDGHYARLLSQNEAA